MFIFLLPLVVNVVLTLYIEIYNRANTQVRPYNILSFVGADLCMHFVSLPLKMGG